MPKVGEFFYVERGNADGGCVLFVHGAGGTHQDWLYQLKEARNHRFLALDLPGHGKSEGHLKSSAEGYSEDVLRFLERLNVKKLKAIVGHSLGGCIATWVYLKGFEVDSIVYVASALKLWGAKPISKIGEDICDMLFYDWRLRVQCKKGKVWDLEALRMDLEAASRCDLRGFAKEINVPTIFIYGYFDRLLPTWAIDESFHLLKGAQRFGVESSHMPMIEKPEIFNRILMEFLNEI